VLEIRERHQPPALKRKTNVRQAQTHPRRFFQRPYFSWGEWRAGRDLDHLLVSAGDGLSPTELRARAVPFNMRLPEGKMPRGFARRIDGGTDPPIADGKSETNFEVPLDRRHGSNSCNESSCRGLRVPVPATIRVMGGGEIRLEDNVRRDNHSCFFIPSTKPSIRPSHRNTQRPMLFKRRGESIAGRSFWPRLLRSCRRLPEIFGPGLFPGAQRSLQRMATEKRSRFSKTRWALDSIFVPQRF
jgi:hypothetical protein